MNPYQHSDLAVFIYRVLVDEPCIQGVEQGDMGDLSCKLASLISKGFDLELQPYED